MTQFQHGAMVGLIIAVGILVRWFRIDYQSIWYDEAFDVLFSGKNLDWIFAQIARDTMPPLHYILLHFWLGLGQQQGSMRALSLLFSAGTIPLTYLLARRLFGHRVALVAILLVAFSPFQIYFAQEARMYTQLSFFSLGAAYFFLKAWQDGSRLAWLGFALASLGAAYTHNLGLLTPLSLDLCALILTVVGGLWSGVGGASPVLRPPSPNPRLWLGANVLLVLAYLPWLPVLWQQASQVKESFCLAAPGQLAIVSTIYSLVFAYALAGNLFVLGLFLVLLLAVLGIYLVARWSVNRDQPMFFCLGILLLPPLAAFVVSYLRPIYLDRTLIGSSFFVYIFLAWVLVRLRPAWLGWLLGAALAMIMLVGLYDYYFVPSFAKPPMHEAALDVDRRLQWGDVVLHTSDGSFLPFVFYDQFYQLVDQNRLIAGDPELATGTARSLALSILDLKSEQVDDLAAGKERIWLVVVMDHSIEWQSEMKGWFDQRYRLESDADFKGIRIYLYVRP